MWHRVNYDYWIVNGDSTEYPSLTMAVKKLDRKYNFTNFPGPLNVLRNIGYTKPPYSKK
jgi:hypothetical protein